MGIPRAGASGDTILSYGKIEDATIKKSRKLGDCVLVKEGMRFTNQRGEIVAKLNSYSFRFKGSDVASNGGVGQSYPPMPEGRFTRNVATPPLLPGTQPTPVRRYDEPHFFEDVNEGDELPPWELGPLDGFRYRPLQSQPRSAPATTGSDGPGTVRMLSRRVSCGSEWFGAMLSRWGGPNSWVTRISQRNEEWVLVAKVICGARVKRKYVLDGRCLVELDIWCNSELGFRTNSQHGRDRA